MTGPTHISPRKPADADQTSMTGTLDHQAAEALRAKTDGQAVYPDYSKGPSAIDKAAKLFFFTEILRGK